MTLSHADLQRHSPLRPPDWRWRRASWLIEHGRYFSRRRDDDETGRAVHYLRALNRCRQEQQRERLARDHPDVHAARLLHEEGGDTAVEVQARLLAGQSPHQIAEVMSSPRGVIATYESLFYNVADKLDRRDWITSQAIGWWRFDLARGRDRATVLRGYAYHGGPVLLGVVLPHLLPGRNPTGPQGDLDRSIRLAIDLDRLPWGAKTDLKLLKLHLELLENSRKAVPAHRIETVVARNVVETLEQLAVRLPQKASSEGDDPKVRQTG